MHGMRTKLRMIRIIIYILIFISSLEAIRKPKLFKQDACLEIGCHTKYLFHIRNLDRRTP